jgi:glycosyltransferase involved in cell wall biosynthesis
MSKSILISIGTLGLGGAEKQAVWLANRLSEDNQVTLLTFTSGEREKDVSSKITRVNVSVDINSRQERNSKSFSLIGRSVRFVEKVTFYVLNRFNSFSIIIYTRIFFRIYNKITRQKPDVVITFLLHDTLMVGLASIFRFRKPVLIIGRRSPFGYGNLIKSGLQKFIFRKIIQKAKVCVTNSNSNIANALLDGVSLEKIVNIPNFIDRADSLKTITEKHDRLRIVCVANMHWYKNHAKLLEAFSCIPEASNYFELDLIGKGPLLQENIALTKKLGLSVNFLTSEDNPRGILKNYDAFILVSSFEGSSNAICEALAEGLPVISSETGNAKELKGFGAPILLCNSESVDSIKYALLELHRNYRELGQNARAFSAVIQDLYSEEKVFSKWDSLIESLLNK